MYSLEQYIKDNAERLDWISSPEQIRTVAGFDAAASLLETYEENHFPLILVEDMCDGYLSFEQGFLDNTMKNLWIMGKPANPEVAAERIVIMDRCFRCGIDILKLLVADFDKAEITDIAYNFDRKRTSYMPMSNIGHCFGWMFVIGFHEDLDLSL
jgi:hypothetical protein